MVINLSKPFVTSVPVNRGFHYCIAVVGFWARFVCKFDLPKAPKMPNDPLSPTVSEVASQQFIYHSHRDF